MQTFIEQVPCERIILKIPRSKSQKYQLSFPVAGLNLELLSAKESKELQDALLIEYCVSHGMFHCVGDATDCLRWLYEMRRD